MTTIYRYKAYCSVHSTYEYIWNTSIPQSDAVHTFTSITQIDKVKSDSVKISEETIATGAHFACETIRVDAIKNTTTTVNTSFPFPISALSIDFISNASHCGDKISVSNGRDTIVGNITSNVSSASAWTAQNYTVGQTVTYTDPTHGSRVYTCYINTVSNEVPTNTTYWHHGLEIPVSQTVIDNIAVGYYVKLYDHVNQDDVARVLLVDVSNLKIYVETNLVNSFLASSPTYIQMTVYAFKNYEMCVPWEHEIGQSKIGGSYLPKDVLVSLDYHNMSTDTDKIFIGRVEYLY